MILTNNYNLPDPIYRAIANDDYSKGDADISTTTLIDSPLQKHLKEKYDDEIREDAAERIYALMGKSMHKIFEMAGGDEEEILEPRYYAEIEDTKLTGQIDRMVKSSDGWIIQDYKWVSVWEYIYGMKKEKECQLNVYAWLARQNGFQVDKLEVIMMFRDWSKMKALKDSSHPPRQVIIAPVALWPENEQEHYIRNRLMAHSQEPVMCTPSERWEKETKFAVMKKGRVSAVRVLDSMEQAELYINTQVKSQDVSKCIIETRTGESIRCEHYCQVKDFCPYYKKGK